MINSGKRLTNEEALDRILKKCKERNIEFVGFNNEENIYKNNKTYLILKCNKCGNVWNTTCYDKFVNGNRACPNCSPTKKLSEKEIIENIKKICKEKDYTFIGFNGAYDGISTKLILKCNKCGEVWNTTTYNNFKKKNRKSHSCGRKNPSSMPSILNEKKAIDFLNEILKNSSLKFVSFDENGYIGRNKSHVLLKCEKCNKTNVYSYRGLFDGKISCKNCEFNGKFSNEKAIDIVKKRCEELNYTFIGFDTDDGNYKGKNTYLILKCNECGIEWKTTTFSSLRHNDIKCPGCVNSWKMEKEIESELRKNSIKYIKQCRNRILPWLKNKISLSLDFYLPDYNIAIECQGRQHFEPVKDFGGEKTFKESIYRDEKKLNLCKNNGIKLLYYDSEHSHTEFLGEIVYNDKNKILKEITIYGQKNKNVGYSQ